MKLSDLKVNSERLEQGAWVGNIPDMGDVELRVRGLGNADYRRLQSRLFDAVPRSKRVGGRLDPVEQDRILSTCLRDAVLTDWRNLTDDQDQPLPYSKELAGKYLSDPDFRAFRDAVIWAASNVAEERAENAKDDAKN